MAPLKLEGYDPKQGRWDTISELKPGSLPGSVADNRPKERVLYVFECADDDSESKIYRIESAEDLTVGEVRRIENNRSQWKLLATLKNGEVYEALIKPDLSNRVREIRFRHEKG